MDFEARGIVKSFGDKQVLRGVDLEASRGSALGLLGRNGAGKTTTIRILMGIFPPDGGKILLDGKPIRRSAVNFGYLPEEHGLYPKKTVSEQLVYLAELRGLNGREARGAVKKWLRRLGMEEAFSRKLETLSKGNQQKIQLAAALLTDPDFIILDEPFSGLDPVNAAVLKDVIREMIAEGKLVLFSSHQMNYVEEFCDSIAILNAGKIVVSGKIRTIKRSYPRSRILVESEQAEKISAFCKNRLGDIVVSSRVKPAEVEINLKSADLKNRLLSALAGQGFDMDGFRVSEPSLNDIFVQYTEGGI